VPRLEREVELGPARLTWGEWPGRRGPLVCLVDPVGRAPHGVAEVLASALAPEWRVLELSPRACLPYQAQAAELVEFLDTFGFQQSVLLGSGVTAALALVVAAWYPTRLAGLILLNGTLSAATRARLVAHSGTYPALRAWLDAPPRWRSIEQQIACPLRRVRARSSRGVVEPTRAFLTSGVQSEACG
jgi:pimeloyl-ACP methyl ester carboxylesterase